MEKEIKFETTFYNLSLFREVLREVKSHYNYIKRAIQKNSDLINSDIKEFSHVYKEKKHLFNQKVSEPEEQRELLKILEEDNFLQDYYPNLIRKSILLLIFSKLENTFRRISKFSENTNGTRIKIKDFNRSGGDIEQIRKFLNLVMDIDFSKINTEWEFIKKINLIRNLISHTDGNLEYYKEIKGEEQILKLENTIKSLSGFEVRQNQLIIFNDNILFQIMESFINFIREVITQLEVKTKAKSFKVTYLHFKDGSREKITVEI